MNLEKAAASSRNNTLDHSHATSTSKKSRLSYVGSEVNIIANPHTDEFEVRRNRGRSFEQLQQEIRMHEIAMASQLNVTPDPLHQGRGLPPTYENVRAPGFDLEKRRAEAAEVGAEVMRRHNLNGGSRRRRRLLPQINTATFTKKPAKYESDPASQPFLPVGYPIFKTR